MCVCVFHFTSSFFQQDQLHFLFSTHLAMLARDSDFKAVQSSLSLDCVTQAYISGSFCYLSFICFLNSLIFIYLCFFCRCKNVVLHRCLTFGRCPKNTLILHPFPLGIHARIAEFSMMLQLAQLWFLFMLSI